LTLTDPSAAGTTGDVKKLLFWEHPLNSIHAIVKTTKTLVFLPDKYVFILKIFDITISIRRLLDYSV
jgi:hypothetical protein